MSTLYLAEFPELRPTHAVAQALEMPPLASQAITIGDTSAQSEQFDTRTRLLQLHADSPCSIVFGLDPVATADDMRIAAGETRIYRAQPGDRLAVIGNT